MLVAVVIIHRVMPVDDNRDEIGREVRESSELERSCENTNAQQGKKDDEQPPRASSRVHYGEISRTRGESIGSPSQEQS